MLANHFDVNAETKRRQDESAALPNSGAASLQPLAFSGSAPTAKTLSPAEMIKKERFLAACSQKVDFEAFVKGVQPSVSAHDKHIFDDCVGQERKKRSDMTTALEGVFRGNPAFSTLCGRLDQGPNGVAKISRIIVDNAVCAFSTNEKGTEIPDLFIGVVSTQLLTYAKDEIGPVGNLFQSLVADLVMSLSDKLLKEGSAKSAVRP